MRRVATVAQNMVPIMAVIYLVTGIEVVGMNIGELPRVIEQIVVGAVNPQAVFGGGVGAAIINGVQRGMLSNEAGMRSEERRVGKEWRCVGGTGCSKIDAGGRLDG